MPTEKKVRRVQKQRIKVDRRGAIYDIHAALQVLDILNGGTSPEVSIAKNFMHTAMAKLGAVEASVKEKEEIAA